MEDKKKILRAEITLIVLIVALVVLFQIIGSYVRVMNNSAEQWSTPEDLHGKTFVSTVGSDYARVIGEIYPESEIIYVQSWADEDMFVSLGKADALITEASSAEIIMDEYPDLIAMEEPVANLECKFAFSGSEFGEQLRDEVDRFLNMLAEDGTLDEIRAHWSDPDAAPESLDIPPMEGPSRGEIRIVTSLDWVPMVYELDGEPAGFFLELCYRFCSWANYEPVLENVSIQSAIAGISTGKYDWICYGMVQTPESDDLYFSQVIYSEPVYVIVNRDHYAGNTDDGEHDSGNFIDNFIEDTADSFRSNFIVESRWKLLLSGLGVTALLSLLSGVFGTILGGFICFLRMHKNTYLTAFARIYIKTVQGIPIMVMLMIIYYVIFGRSSLSAFWACVIGFSIDFSAYCAEIFRSGIEAVPRNQMRAATALGFSRAQAFRHVVLPQTVVHVLPVYMGQFISMVKMTSVAGYISVEDLTKISDIIRSRTYEAFFPLIFSAIVYFLLAALLMSCLKYLQLKVDPSVRRREIKGVIRHDT